MPNVHWTWKCSPSAFKDEIWKNHTQPVYRLDNGKDTQESGLWAGSGFRVSDLPPYHYSHNPLWYHDILSCCQHCKQNETLCRYLRNVVAYEGCTIEAEVYCPSCGWFTFYEGDS